jgi:hypothetical protein
MKVFGNFLPYFYSRMCSIGIMHHTDGPIYYDCVAILSLNSPTVMTFRPRLSAEEIGLAGTPSADTLAIVLRARSLLVFRADAYHKYMHGIPLNALGKEHVDEYPFICNLLESDTRPGDEVSVCVGGWILVDK